MIDRCRVVFDRTVDLKGDTLTAPQNVADYWERCGYVERVTGKSYLCGVRCRCGVSWCAQLLGLRPLTVIGRRKKEAALNPTLFFLVSVLVVTLAVRILAIIFSAKRFRPEATLAVVLAVVAVGGWVWRMPQGWYTISQIARRYGLETRQVREVAKRLGVRAASNRGALVPPSQRKKMYPELMRLKKQMRLEKQRALRESSAPKDSRVVYESSDGHSGFLEEADCMQFSGEELLRHLHPNVTEYVADVEDEAG